MWERGLKHAGHAGVGKCVPSLPMWERGLKLYTDNGFDVKVKSLPMWERGLKQRIEEQIERLKSRSPCGSVD